MFPLNGILQNQRETKKRILDMSRAKSHGFETKISIEDGIRETINWFSENKEKIEQRYNVFRR